MSAGGESKGSSGSGGGESKNNNKNKRGMQQANDPWGEKWLSSEAAEKHVYNPTLRQGPEPEVEVWTGDWLGPKRALYLAKGLRGPPLGREKNNKHTIRVGASNQNVALMHEGHKQLAALNNKKSGPRSKGIGKLAKDLKSAKNKRLPAFEIPELVRTTGYYHSGLGRFVGTPPSQESVQENDLRKNIRAIGRARKRTKRYNKVLKATRGRLSTGNHLPEKHVKP